jgi:hypothetical protein
MEQAMITRGGRHRAARRFAAAVTMALSFGFLALLAAAGGAAAQSNPYGRPPPPPPEFDTTCSLSAGSATPGETITGTVDGAPPSADVSVTYDGDFIKSGKTDAQGHAAIDFVVPPGSELSPHHVAFTGAGFACSTEVTQVLGLQVGQASGTGRGNGSLAKTGIEVALLLAVALVLIVVGLQIVRRARRQRQRLLAAERRRTLVR